jgi:hypothetical protein
VRAARVRAARVRVCDNCSGLSPGGNRRIWIERQLGLEPLVDGRHHRATLDPLGNVGLVSDDQEEKACCFQVCQSIRDPG